MKRVRVRFVGRVQGVGFRATCRSLASGRPVTGWVRNEHDGAVLMETQGTATAVAEFLQAIRERMSRNIEQMDVADVQVAADESEFCITR